MKILVTGGAGFIGCNFVYYMLKKYPEYDIVCLDSLTYAGNIKSLKEKIGTITDFAKFYDMTRETDKIDANAFLPSA